ncbi:MAG: DNA sulfur modification protein DndD [Cenarchaeum symbiont of Oopsacas minuta]|nr:DNA sulfur modification protein DndD [Cenarchaeum symbiont of Oopsacas minuta]
MLLTNLALENYGVYKGRNELDLSCTVNKPIVLIRGLNGNGKTTILEAMMVALYGRIYLGSQATKKDYSKFIQDRMHRSLGIRTNHASLSVSFQFHHNGQNDTYMVKREWIRGGGDFEESLIIEKNGKRMLEMDDEQWRQFIEGLIPFGITKLFFFDGDRMTKIAKWNKQGRNPELKKSFDMLLGTELVKRLKSDLEVYVMRKSGKTDPTLTKQFQEQEEEKNDIQNSITILRDERKHKSQEHDDVVTKIRVLESEILHMGGWYSKKRETLISQKSISESNVTHLHENLTSMLESTIPFCILPDQFLSRITKKLESDIKMSGGRFAKNLIEKKIVSIENNEITSKKISKLNRSTVLEILNQLLDECTGNNLYFDLSPNERDKIIYMVINKKKEITSLYNTSSKYADLKKKLLQVEMNLANVPKDDEIGPKITELNALNLELGRVKNEIDELDRKISSKESYLRIVQSRMEKLLKSAHLNGKNSTGVTLAGLMQKTLTLYYAGLRAKKMIRLEENLLESIHVLMRKNMINRVSIDNDNFSIIPYDKNGDSITGGLMSMGEKQMVGTSLLWALARTSERPLPFVIDTPLARLDGVHRSNLIESFYPFASHQIVMLSTDKEIDQKEYTKLRNYISKTYSLVQDGSSRVTNIIDGYVMEEEIVTK